MMDFSFWADDELLDLHNEKDSAASDFTDLLAEMEKRGLVGGGE